MGDDADWADVKVEDDMPTAQNAPSEAAAAARAILAARKPPPPADDGDSDEEGAAAPQAPQRSSCRHSVAVPPDWQGDRAALDAPSYDGERAKTYPFVLDAFQETSVSVLEQCFRKAQLSLLQKGYFLQVFFRDTPILNVQSTLRREELHVVTFENQYVTQAKKCAT